MRPGFIALGIIAAVASGFIVFALLVRPVAPSEKYFSRTTIDGVDCIVYSAAYKGSISCNWERYNQEHP